MLKVLKQKAWLGFVGDQKPRGRKGPVVCFFHQKIAFVAGPAVMAKRLNIPILVVFCVREGPMCYRYVSDVCLLPEDGETDEQKITQIVATKIEEIVRLYPEQWCWNYKRWQWD